MADEEKVKTLDLRGVACPLNWAKARVVLEELERGDPLVLLVDDPRALRDIPRAAEALGYLVEPPEDLAGGGWGLRITV
jgi:TusA-related sulfurtransferase